MLLKYTASLTITFVWFYFSLYLAYPWIVEVANTIGVFNAVFIIGGICLVPALTMSFVYSILVLNRLRHPKYIDEYPPVSILIASFNEELSIARTIESIINSRYNQTPIEIILCDDGSVDRTSQIAQSIPLPSYITLKVSRTPTNFGKSTALNLGLDKCSHDTVLTVDADTTLHPYALKTIVSRFVRGKSRGVGAIAGNVQVNNPEDSWVTKIQNWDYILGISCVKQAQSYCGGTLVAQGAFSIYDRQVLKKVGGWGYTVGEDIVLSWSILNNGYQILYEPFAVCFTNVPKTYKQFFGQRKRWSRGLVEAFLKEPTILFKFKRFSPFVWYNMMFPYLDLSYLLFLFPSVIVALVFQYYLLAGLMTVLLLPMSLALSLITLTRQRWLFEQVGVRMEYNWLAFIAFIFSYQLIMAPSTLSGYISEVFKMKKTWETK
jgi:biofilm PGA synthesis N-glycosyltransferase PgaC